MKPHRMTKGLLAAGLLLACLATPPARAFSWANCGGPDATASLSSLDVSPDPWVAGGELTVVGLLVVTQAIAASNGYRVRVEHRVNDRLLPCLGPLEGSCEYLLCETMEQHFTEVWGTGGCPITNSNCRCPFSQGQYFINPPGITYPVPDRLERFYGQNDVRVTFIDGLGPERLCVDFSFEVQP